MSPADPIDRALEDVALPDTAGEGTHRALAALRAGRADEALALLDGGTDEAADHVRGLALLRRGDPWRAVASLEQALAAAPESFGPLMSLAAARESQQAFDEAAELLRRALAARPDHPGAIAALARCYNAVGRVGRAESLARRGLELAPEDAALAHALAESLQRQDRHAEVVEALRGVTPGDPRATVTLGRSLLHLRRGEEAGGLFAEALRRSAESPDALAGMAEALVQIGRLQEAPGYVLRALAAAPDRADLHLFHARLLLALGRPQAAENAATNAASLEPDEPAAHRAAMEAAQARRKPDRAAAHAREVLRLRPDDTEALVVRALALVAAGDAAEALALVSPQLAMDAPPGLRVAAGAALLVLGRPEEAAAHLASDPEGLLARDLRALAAEPQRSVLRAIRRRLGAEEGDEDELPDDSSVRSQLSSRRPAGSTPRPVEAVVTQLLGPRTEARPPTGPLASISVLPPPVPAPEAPLPELPPLVLDEAALPEPPELPEPPALPEPLDADESDERPSEHGSAVSAVEHSSLSASATATLSRLHGVRRVLTDPSLADLGGAVDRLIETYDQPLLLAILGPPGAGKTTFVNALIGADVIPEGTRVALMLRYGSEPGGRVLYRDGRVSTVRIRDLRAFLEANEEALSAAAVRFVEVLVPIEELTRARILDLPDPLAPGDAEPLLAEADAALWLVGADQSGKHWREAAQWLGRSALEAVAVVTRVDGQDEASVAKAVSRAERALGRRVHGVAAVSARQGLDGLARRDMDTVRASGFARLHRVLRLALFDRAAEIRQAAVRLRLRRILARALGRLDDRMESLAARETSVSLFARRIEEERRGFRRDVGDDAVELLRRRIEGAVDAAAMAAWDEGLEDLGPALAHVVADGVDALRADLDQQLAGRLDGLFEALEGIFPGGVGDPIATRVAGLRGIIDGYRELRAEQVFGRHRAYLEGWIDRLPPEPLQALESAATALDLVRARPLELDGLADPLFDGLAAFAEETLTELREAREELARQVVAPLEAAARAYQDPA